MNIVENRNEFHLFYRLAAGVFNKASVAAEMLLHEF